ncbi:MAG: anti-sigma factor [Sphingobacteriales bacterium]|nr:anti-sigma factor [Sphingobacteriales bacterium]
MNVFIKSIAVAALSVPFLTSCKKNNDVKTETLTVGITGLEDLGANARYEGWIMVGGTPVSTGTFSVNATGQLSQTTFEINKDQLNNATAFVLTVEPFPDANPAPSEQKLLAGDFSGNTANATIGHPAALNTTFTTAIGKYVLATPTTASLADELSGVWFLSLMTGSPTVGLSLPALPTGWRYEGWALIAGKPVTTGTFTNVTGADASAPYSGTLAAPPFPGEDFIMNAPSGSIFPTNLSGGLAVISVEPFPDNSPAPFLLKPLVGNIPGTAVDHFTYSMALNAASFPTGVVTRN